MRKYLFIAVLIEFLIILCMIVGMRHLNAKYETAVNNNKAYEQGNLQFEMTMRQLGMQMDSISSECMRVKDSLKIKDRKVKEIVYVKSNVYKTDTIAFRDTIIAEGIIKDTMLCDRWYSLDVHVSYPDTIAVTPRFVSEKVIIASTERQTINPPRKFFLFRWFQKKHTVTRVDIVENNPYIDNGTVRDYKIIK